MNGRVRKAVLRAAIVAVIVAMSVGAAFVWYIFGGYRMFQVETGMKSYRATWKELRGIGIEHFPSPGTVPHDARFTRKRSYWGSGDLAFIELDCGARDVAGMRLQYETEAKWIGNSGDLDVQAGYPGAPLFPDEDGQVKELPDSWSIYVLGVLGGRASKEPGANWTHVRYWGLAIPGDDHGVRYWAMWW